VIALTEDQDADVVVVGGGISGMATAYHLLATTGLRVTVLEASTVGSGASGNNGGQAVEGAESGFREIEAMAGRERTVQSFMELAAAREILKRMLREIGSPSMLTEVTGRLGLADQAAIERWAGDIEARREAGMNIGKIHVSEDAPVGMLRGAPRTPRAMLARQLWSRDRRYIATLEVKVGLINTCDLVETLATRLLEQYPDRAVVLERSPVDLIRLSEEDSAVRSNGHIVLADSVVICTNGYPIPRIEACSPPLMGNVIRRVVGYMVGSEGGSGAEGARAYFPEEDNYYYVARRRYRGGRLTAAGGPEGQITGPYDPGKVYHPGAYERLESFLAGTLDGYAGPSCRRWQGLMGYTRTGMRVVGTDPRLPSLSYNLGCNGIGILSAVAGAKRLAAMMGGEDLGPSAFDPEVLSGVAPPEVTGIDRGRAYRP
jgi:glycine/D-amino acid oxidase-like deaminating enzyme